MMRKVGAKLKLVWAPEVSMSRVPKLLVVENYAHGKSLPRCQENSKKPKDFRVLDRIQGRDVPIFC